MLKKCKECQVENSIRIVKKLKIKKIEKKNLEEKKRIESLPDKNFLVSCFPVKIKKASAGWTRAVAIIDSERPQVWRLLRRRQFLRDKTLQR